MIPALLLSLPALAADHGGPTDPAAGDFTFDITVQADLLIDCSVQGAGLTTAAFGGAGLNDAESVSGVSFGTLGSMGNLYGWFNTGLWYVGGEAVLNCANTPGLATVAVDASATGTGGADGFFNFGHADFNAVPPTNTLISGAGAVNVIAPTAVPFNQNISLGAEIDALDNPSSSATITFTFIPA